MVPGVIPTYVQDFALPVADLHSLLISQACRGPFGWRCNQPGYQLSGSDSSQLCVTCKLSGSALSYIIQVINEEIA